MKILSLASALSTLLLLLPMSAGAQTPDLETLWKIVQQQQAQIAELQASLQEQQAKNSQVETRLAEQQLSLLQQNRRLEETEQFAEAVAAAPMAAAEPKVQLGGYGELHYNDLDNGEKIDYHRFVLFLSHQFRDDLTFFSEVELEHSIAGDGKPGEVELEQAYVQWDYQPGHNAKLGLFLLPVGILNETHEPDTFYGVERNSVEAEIIPSTWWEAGVSLGGEVAPGWNYDFAVHSGLALDTDNTSAAKRTRLRSGRQKVGEANGDSLAYTARLRYSGIPGFQWNTSLQYQSDLTQGDADGIGIDGIDGRLLETNVQYQRGMFGLRALYARWDIDSDIELLNPGADEQYGWLIEPSLRINEDLGIFARYSSYDLTAGSSATSDEKTQINIGLNYWLHDNVVLKFDYQKQDNDKASDVDGFNLGLGYSF